MEGFGDFPDDAANGADNLNFGDGDDVFASSGADGAADPFGGSGLQMNSQPDGYGAAID